MFVFWNVVRFKDSRNQHLMCKQEVATHLTYKWGFYWRHFYCEGGCCCYERIVVKCLQKMKLHLSFVFFSQHPLSKLTASSWIIVHFSLDYLFKLKYSSYLNLENIKMLYNSELKSLQDREEISITDMLDHQYGQNINPLLYIAFGLGFLYFFLFLYSAIFKRLVEMKTSLEGSLF